MHVLRSWAIRQPFTRWYCPTGDSTSGSSRTQSGRSHAWQRAQDGSDGFGHLGIAIDRIDDGLPGLDRKEFSLGVPRLSGLPQRESFGADFFASWRGGVSSVRPLTRETLEIP